MQLTPGTKLAEYEIIDSIGAGGMGEVYKARDAKLGREVAIKVLPAAFAEDKERLARFEREARLLASMNHPNIATIHGLEESDGVHFLVLELVPGETLAERIKRGPISVEEALPLFKQIAEGLEAAHEKGVIHRDLKPANVKITPDGKPKILDFGLAKAMASEIPQQGLSESPTMTRGATEAGILLGTAPYMSPEQARGKGVDKRTDIWAFGCCLYEALTGKTVFFGETVSDTIAAVLKQEPEWQHLPAGTPAGVRRLLRRCLQKNQNMRMRDIGEARIEMSGVSSAPSKADEPVADGPRSKAPLWMALGAAAATLLTWGFLKVQAPSPPRVARATIALPVGTSQRRLLNASIAISPDGSLLAYAAEDAGGSALFLRPLDRFETKRLHGTEGADMPFFSPDGQRVGFFAAGQLKKISVDGGSAVTITRAPSGLGASWGADDVIVYAPATNAGLFRVSADGGEPEQLTKPGFDETGYAHVWPHHLPGARAVLFTVWGGNAGPATLNLESGEWRRILEGLEQNVFGSIVYATQYLPIGHLLFADPGRGAGLFAVQFDPEKLTATGATTSVLDDVRFLDSESAWPFATVSQTGTMVYIAAGTEPSTLAWMNRAGESSPIIHRNGSLAKPRLSPDGKMVLFHDDQGNIWILDIERGTTDLVADRTDLEGNAWSYVWSPDGRRFAFSSNRAGSWDLYEKKVSERGKPEALLIRGLDQYPSSWSPDGQILLFTEDHPVSGQDLWLLQIGEEPTPLLVTQFNEKWAAFSPDGRFLSYVSDESGRYQVYVRSYPQGETFLVSIDGGEEPVWSRDGRELFFRHGNAFLVVDVTTELGFRASAPRVLHESSFDRSNYGGETYYDVSPDGERFLVVADRSTTKLQVVFNWHQELLEKVPVK